MNNIDIINKKEKNEYLSYEELDQVFNGYLNGDVNDTDMTRLLKSICLYGLSEEEIYNLTDIFIKSGDTLDLSELGIVVDKHSTGGVGDTVTLVVAPLVAACGVKIAKMSGRALGHTGGTIDKLESIKGFNVSLTEREFIDQVKRINIAITSQTGEVAPMDKKVYALRNVTNTTMSIPLIASSIMSKKVACGANKIIIDVKIGDGALITNLKDARELSRLMINIGKKYNKEVKCILTNMAIPLGKSVGNGLEVKEAIEVLDNKSEGRLRTLSIEMAAILVSMASEINLNDARQLVKEKLISGEGLNKFKELIINQHGDFNSIAIDSTFIPVKAEKSGYLSKIDALALGKLCNKLGAGRIEKYDEIDYGSGAVLNKDINEYVNKGDVICYLYTKKEVFVDDILPCFDITDTKSEEIPLIYEIIE